MKNALTLFLLVLLGGMVHTNAAGQDYLNSYLQTAAENNPGLKARYDEYMAALTLVDQTSGLPDPQLAFSYLIRPVETRVGPQEARFSLTQMFPWFGTLRARGNAASKMAKAKFELFEQTRSRLFFDVKTAYYELTYIEHAIGITKENIKILTTFKNLASIMIESGAASLIDQIMAEMDIADLENVLAGLQDKREVQRLLFQTLMNTEDVNPVIPAVLPEYDLNLSKPTLLDSIRLNNHQLRNLHYITEHYQSREAAAKLAGMPSFSVGVDYISVGKSDNPNLDEQINGKDAVIFPKIGITLPLYRKKYSAMTREARLLQSASESQRIDRENTLKTVFEKAYREFIDAGRRIDLYMKQRDYARHGVRILESDYSTGSARFEELLRMEKRWLSYSLNLERARSDREASAAFIRFLMGN